MASEPIQYVEIDVDYCSRSYGDGLCYASLLVDQSRTNNILQSQTLDNASWTKTRATVSANTGVAPDLTSTADSLVEDTTTGTHLIRQNFTGVADTTYTTSVYVKANGRTACRLFFSDSTLANQIRVDLDITTGTTTSSVNGLGAVSTIGSEDMGNGWRRVWVTGIVDTTSTTLTATIQPANPLGVLSYLGDGVSGLFVWGFQSEVGANPSDYKPTTTVAVTTLWKNTRAKKCFNTFGTCQAQDKFVKTVKTISFINNRSNLPKGLVAYPVLKEGGVSAFSSTVNIAGSNPRMNAFGRRATVSVALEDFVDDDIWFDKYQPDRISGKGQSSGVGYDPGTVGTFFTRLKARWPHYAGRSLRLIDGNVDGGILTVTQTRHFIITDVVGPDRKGNVTFEGKDVLALADDKKALAPAPSRGKLGAAITAATGQSFPITPTGIEVEYPTSGTATIGSEVVSYTRSGVNITLTGRGQNGTVAGAKAIGDSFQVALKITAARVDDVVYDLLTNYAKVPASFCPKVTEWAPEITKWMSSALLDTVITKPTGVAQLIGELSDLGISVWWDEVNQKVKLKATHPVENELITPISDDLDIKDISQEDSDEDRITQVHFYTKQTDPTKDYKDKNNYNTLNVLVDTEAESPNAYFDTKVREVFCRWLNDGADSTVRILSLRLLKRLNTPPIHYTILLDADLNTLNLVDVIELDSRVSTDDTGLPVKRLLQIIRKTGKKSGHEFEVEAQSFAYNGKYGTIMANGSPVYGSASDTQKRLGGFFVGPLLKFSDGSPPYAFI